MKRIKPAQNGYPEFVSNTETEEEFEQQYLDFMQLIDNPLPLPEGPQNSGEVYEPLNEPEAPEEVEGEE